MAKYSLEFHNGYFKDLKRARLRGLDESRLNDVIYRLVNDDPLPARCHNHLLHGDYKGYWECHVGPDWLLIYEKDTEIRILTLYRTGTHADLFEKGKKR